MYDISSLILCEVIREAFIGTTVQSRGSTSKPSVIRNSLSYDLKTICSTVVFAELAQTRPSSFETVLPYTLGGNSLGVDQLFCC